MRSINRILNIRLTCLLIFGMVFLGIFCMVPDCPAQTGICGANPCQSIPNATVGSCTEVGGLCAGPSDYACSCDWGYSWQPVTHTCEAAAIDPCDPDPCASIPNAVPDSCVAFGDEYYFCSCATGYTWQESSNTCASPPQIADLMCNPSSASVGEGAGGITVACTVLFQDADMDLETILVRFRQYCGGGSWQEVPKDVTSQTAGLTQGEIDFDFLAETNCPPGNYPYEISARDSNNNVSNVLTLQFLLEE